MLPIVFDWDWSLGRWIFMGALYMVLAVVGTGLAVAFFRTVKNLSSGGAHGEGHGEAHGH